MLTEITHTAAQESTAQADKLNSLLNEAAPRQQEAEPIALAEVS